MRILLVNDDGYRAPGLRTLGHALQQAGHQVIVAAPDRERSAASHSFTIQSPLRAKTFREDGLTGYAIDGTPADCARLGLFLMDNQVDFVMSGINQGANMGGACVYSGTVGAAVEAAMAGCPAMAVSLDSYASHDFGPAAQVALKVLDWAAVHPLERGEIYNLNVPALPYQEILGVRTASLSPVFLGRPRYEKHVSPYGVEHYYLTDGEPVPMEDPECDFLLCQAGWATLTPITWNMVAQGGMHAPEVTL